MFDNETDQTSNKLISNTGEKADESPVNSKYIVQCNKYRYNPNIKIPKTSLNKISTSKYTWYNCIPKILFEQFSKMSNIYFLIIAVMQCFREISNADGKPIILMPLAIVVAVNGLKDFWEDWKRKKSDDEENNRIVQIFSLDSGIFENRKWEDVMIGNIIKVKEKEYFPADCVLISSSEKNYNCYVETKNLDGETNLKFKKAIKQLVDAVKNTENSNEVINEKKLSTFQGTLVTKQPNEFIYEFNAIFNFDSSHSDISKIDILDFQKGYINSNFESPSIITSNTVSDDDSVKKMNNKSINIIIEKDSFLLRGCSLQQTEYVIGIVVYVGHNTKIMKNSPTARSKISTIEHIMNLQIIFIFIFQALLSLVGASVCIIQLNTGDMKHKISYLTNEKEFGASYFFLRLGTWIVLLNNLVPISLLVTMEMVKYVQGIFISWDYQIYDTNTRTPTKVQTSTLNEELGQVRYIFSDKTGTLTKNYMQFKKMAIGEYSYGNNGNNYNKLVYTDEYGLITNFAFNDQLFTQHLYGDPNIIGQQSEIRNQIDLFLTCLATCHSIITNQKEQEKGTLIYQSSSPDETAMVNCARFFKYIFCGRDINNHIFIQKENNVKLTYTLLCEFEYTSERKRMSVILRCPDNKIRLFMKGADNIVLQRVNPKASSEESITKITSYINEYAKEGLRTLMIAYKEISEEEFAFINNDYIAAQSDTYQKDVLLNQLSDRTEQNLTLLGITGIEDQLQDNVGDVLHSFNIAGIKIWVLTGDKKETAKSIAYSCKLLNNETFTIFDFEEGKTAKEIYKDIRKYSREYNRIINENRTDQSLIKRNFAVLISQDELKIVMSYKKIENAFYELANRCNTVLCCRVTPKQKAQMVNLVKKHQPKITTLAIGDGANDVNMITAANIGIGIIGVEGKQAARASDYAIGQFQFLKRLLFIHGRESYRKNSFIVCYNFYKNFLFVIPQFILGFDSLFGGQTIYDPWIYQLYNIVFAAFPIIWFGVYDKQVSGDKLISNPKYYTQGIVGKLFGSRRFWKWIFYGTVQALVLYVFSFRVGLDPYNIRGDVQDLKLSGTICYSFVVVIVNVKVFQTTSTHSVISILLVTLSVLLYYAFVAVMSLFPSFYNYGNFMEMITSLPYFLKLLVIILICLVMDLGIKTVFKICRCIPDPLEISIEDLDKSDIKLDETGVTQKEEDDQSIEIELSDHQEDDEEFK